MIYKIIETHCHLDYLKDHPLEEILEVAKSQGVEKFLTIAVEPDNFDTVYELSQKYPEVYFTQGIHPHDAKLFSEEAFAKIEQRAPEEKMLAVGEIGLDYHYDNSPRDIQKQVFKKQLEIAIKLTKPVVIHSRDADEDTISILKHYAPLMKRKGVIHSFTSGENLARTAMDLGFYLGFNGIITFKNAGNVRDIVTLAPIEKILVETDSPFLAPIPFRGRENSPKNIPHIIEKIAEIKGLDPEQVANITFKNAMDCFSF